MPKIHKSYYKNKQKHTAYGQRDGQTLIVFWAKMAFNAKPQLDRLQNTCLLCFHLLFWIYVSPLLSFPSVSVSAVPEKPHLHHSPTSEGQQRSRSQTHLAIQSKLTNKYSIVHFCSQYLSAIAIIWTKSCYLNTPQHTHTHYIQGHITWQTRNFTTHTTCLEHLPCICSGVLEVYWSSLLHQLLCTQTNQSKWRQHNNNDLPESLQYKVFEWCWNL